MSTYSPVAVIKTGCFQYPANVEAFRPGTSYPEYHGALSPDPNPIYDGVREALHLLGLDAERYGTPDWNPLGEYVRPGMNVLIKPNLVMDVNQNPDGGTDCLYTQPSVVAPMVDYILLALNGSGSIVIGDAPMQSCDFDRLIRESGYQDMAEYYQKQGADVRLVDFRGSFCRVVNGVHISEEKAGVSGAVIDLGAASEFAAEDQEKLRRMRITNYDPRLLQSHHQSGKHEYEISRYVLDADVIINMPKPKTHRKAGVTISLKNFVGANVHKEFLPHHTKGAYSQGGDEYPRRSVLQALRGELADRICLCEAEKRYRVLPFYRFASALCCYFLNRSSPYFSEGSWYGNHTISRTVADVNKLVYYAGKDGSLQDKPARSVLILADMIVSGEGEGPVLPSPKKAGILAAGLNPVCFDEAVAALMGMAIEKIPTLQTVRKIKEPFKLATDGQAPIYVSNDPALHEKTPQSIPAEALLRFTPSAGWAGHIERE